MGRTITATVFLALCVFVQMSPCTAQPLDDAAILAAIRAGESGKIDRLTSDCVAKPGMGEGMGRALGGGVQPTGKFDVISSTNAGRIAHLAAEGKRLYKPLKHADVPETLRGSLKFYVIAIPQKPYAEYVPSPIQHIVLKSKTAPSAVVQPEHVDKEAVEWGNLMGGKIQGNQAVATFDISHVKELPAGDIDVVLVTEAGERRCKVGAKDRAKILGGGT